MYLFHICQQHNPNSRFITHPDQLETIEFSQAESVGICGATSTPRWLMEECVQFCQQWIQNNSDK